MRTYLLKATIFTISIIISVGCTKEKVSQEDTLVVGIQGTIFTLDPAMHRDRTTESVIRNMFDGLVTRDSNMRVVPQLAESWELVDDLTWRFRLRNGVKFHNGEDFTAEDVFFTIERIIKPNMIDGESSPRKGLLGPVSAVEIEDDFTVLIKTKEPWPILPVMLPFQEIVPKDYIKEKGSAYFAQ
ncbi:TPA: ABC transporter substrate-binding protein, partial [Candidatus Poribacteria bacterium]|nr:ABC transporter substrate-binding protein [Candidatus Poribacteria bacterium]